MSAAVVSVSLGRHRALTSGHPTSTVVARDGIDQIDLTDVPRRMHGCRFLDSEKLADARLPGARRLGGAVCTLCEQRRTNADLQRHSHVNVISEAAFDQLAPGHGSPDQTPDLAFRITKRISSDLRFG